MCTTSKRTVDNRSAAVRETATSGDVIAAFAQKLVAA
jgi:hypothetical protein